jgi:glycosylphosphatidylinositol transamidase (GPIT) subunit GPI8
VIDNSIGNISGIREIITDKQFFKFLFADFFTKIEATIEEKSEETMSQILIKMQDILEKGKIKDLMA